MNLYLPYELSLYHYSQQSVNQIMNITEFQYILAEVQIFGKRDLSLVHPLGQTDQVVDFILQSFWSWIFTWFKILKSFGFKFYLA